MHEPLLKLKSLQMCGGVCWFGAAGVWTTGCEGVELATVGPLGHAASEADLEPGGTVAQVQDQKGYGGSCPGSGRGYHNKCTVCMRW